MTRASVPGIEPVVGCLLAGALGDALGYPVEFLKQAEIVDRWGRSPPASLSCAGEVPAPISDDTQMTLFSAEGILRSLGAGVTETQPDWGLYLLGAYQRWYGTQALRSAPLRSAPIDRGPLLSELRLHARRAPGSTCLSAIARSFLSDSLASPSEPANHSKGCGAIMRSAPFGLAAPCAESAFTQAKIAGALTHGHPSGYLSAAYFAVIVYALARGESLTAALLRADELLAAEDQAEEVREAVQNARLLAQQVPNAVGSLSALGQGWTGEEALAIAIYCALRHEQEQCSVESSLWLAAAHDGDSDSTASLVGNLLGATLGVPALPTAWLEQLELRELIESVAQDLHRAVALGDVELARYPRAHDCFRVAGG